MKTRTLSAIAAFALASTVLAGSAYARDQIRVVGSSTVYPFTTAVAEQFGRAGKFKTPKVESTGTGGGIKLLCSGVGVAFIDIANASRRIKQTELDTCRTNGVKEVVEVKIGYDGIVLANAKASPTYKLTRKDIWMALAKQVPNPADPASLVPNPYKTWKQVNSSLPDVAIEVLGPPPTSGTRDAFVELVMEQGCSTVPWIKALKDVNERRFKQICGAIREDGAYVEAGENDNLIVQKLQANPKALGIFGYSFLEENLGTLHGSIVEGSAPEFDAISSGRYPVSRSLYFYVKKAHIGVIPGITEFVNEFLSEKAAGGEGYLADKGMIPLHAGELAAVRKDWAAQKAVKL